MEKKISKILIANRGEIATRIIRACKELGITSVAIYSEVDRNAHHVRKADKSYLVGPGPLEGYLNYHRIVDLAKEIQADAIHPGYGFLSENPDFAKYCEEKGITFIGPSSEAIALMGNKVEARNLARKIGLPLLPGTDEPVKDEEEAVRFANSIGYPVIIKAAFGGGGRGMRVSYNEKELRRYINICMSESKKAFGKADIFIEKYLEAPHHIEFQILADSFGNTIHLGERDCSIQRRHQKLVEIAPSMILSQKKREEMGKAAVALAKAVNYKSAGTVEFLVDKKGNYYFMEMNTRIQVEHPVTEVVTGVDLIKEMIRVAEGKPLDIKQKDVNLRGFAIEVRICAEDPKNNFMPDFGRITQYNSPGGIGVRLDGAVYQGYTIPPYYDSMIVKLIVYGRTWEETVSRLKRALDEYVIRGIKTTIPFYKKIVSDPDFLKGNIDTWFIDKKPHLLDYTDYIDPMDYVTAVASAIAVREGVV
ncbi:MAG: acetyl-CoA carboxylase biotin carboxylase subunit [Proteobacteria bacterium]|nr:acetyl-CoA carboxylase biotin carboxylase subunit [Pseudomonadota bacterium]